MTEARFGSSGDPKRTLLNEMEPVALELTRLLASLKISKPAARAISTLIARGEYEEAREQINRHS